MSEIAIQGYPYPVVLEKDGRLGLAPLQMEPATIIIEGKAGLVGEDGFTKRTWSELLEVLPHKEDLGSAGTPLCVVGSSKSGVSCIAPQMHNEGLA